MAEKLNKEQDIPKELYKDSGSLENYTSKDAHKKSCR